ncbi:MAG: leucine-rich repeat domain-containing protein [Salinivirgaceae bacterium]|nr:leucine-rich repeat domain-containing protein [Salinivirgaceae bacterium]
MKNKILIIAFLLMTSVSAMGFTIDSLNLEFSFTYLDNQQVVSVKASETKPEGDLVIPSTVEYDGETYTVASISWFGFRECSGLTSVIIPNSVRTIGEYAFADCKNLTSVVIGDSVKKIGKNAFLYCNSLTKVEFSSLESLLKIEYDGYDANPIYYAKCLYINGKEVAELIILNTIKKINDYAFINCQSLTSVVIGDSVKSIGDYAFSNCVNLTSVVIGDSVNSIGRSAFYGCLNLKPVFIPETVSTIGDDAFYCDKSIVYSGNAGGRSWGAFTVNGVIDGDFVYSDTQKTKLSAYVGDGGDVVIPDAVVKIGRYAFYWCTNLTSVTIPNTIDTIGYRAFAGCTATIYCNVKEEPGGWDSEWCGKEYKGEIVWKTSTPVTEKATNAVNIYAYGRSIVVENAAEEIRVYDAMGRMIGRDAINRVRTEICVNNPGLYIVKVGNVAKRVVVK